MIVLRLIVSLFSGTNAMLEHVIETEDVHAAVYKATALGAQLVGKIFSNNDARIEAKISDPFGFLWVFLSLWSNSRMEHCNIVSINISTFSVFTFYCKL